MRGMAKMGVKISTFRKNFHFKSKPNKFALRLKKLELMKCKTSPRIKPNVRILIFGACTPIQHGRLVVKLVYFICLEIFGLRLGSSSLALDGLHWHGVPACLKWASDEKMLPAYPYILPAWKLEWTSNSQTVGPRGVNHFKNFWNESERMKGSGGGTQRVRLLPPPLGAGIF